MSIDTAPQAQTWTDKQLMLEAEVIVGGGYGIQPVYSVLHQVRDDLQATIDRQAQEIAALKQSNDEIMGIGTPHLDSFTEQQLERYAQLSPPEMFRLLLNCEAAACALYAALERRQECEECHGSGTVPWIDYSEDDVSLEPCLCWSDAEAVLAEYATWKESEDEKPIATVDWVAPSGRKWKIDLYEGDEDATD